MPSLQAYIWGNSIMFSLLSFHRDWKNSHLKNQNTTGLNCPSLSPQVGISAPVNDVLRKITARDQDGLTKQDIAGVRDVPCDRTIIMIVERTIIPRARAQ